MVQTVVKAGSMTRQNLWGALTTRRLLVIFLFLGIFGRAIREANDADMWWHLAAGRLIVSQGAVPSADGFSFTAAGAHWVTQEWLTEVGMYVLYLLGGKSALIIAVALVVTLAFVLVYVQCSARPHVAVFLVLAGAFASAVGWSVRPQILTMAGLALFSFLLALYRQGRRWTLVIFPLLTAIWVNLHAGYLVGLAYLVLNLAGDGLAMLFERTGTRTLTLTRWRELAWSVVASLPAALANPNGWHMLRFPFGTLTSPAIGTYIQEWASPDFHDPGLWPFAVLLLGGAVLLIEGRRHALLELSEILTFAAFAAAALYSGRHIPLFAVTAPAVISRAIPWDAGRIRAMATRWSVALNWLLLLGGAATVGLRLLHVVAQDRTQEALRYPQAALGYIEAQGWTERRVFNSYNWGGYLIWHQIPVFMDGRAEVYGDALMLEYLTTYHLASNWREPLDDYKVDYILIETQGPLSTLLMEAPDWDRVYQDDVADIFVRQ